jgi:hypothetical protein
VVAYVSRGLKDHEKNYTAFLLEKTAACWEIDYFDMYLTPPKQFTLCTNHRPLETMSTVHKKTLNDLQLLMLKFNFVIEYKEGWRNTVADELSRTHAGVPLCVVTRSGRRTAEDNSVPVYGREEEEEEQDSANKDDGEIPSRAIIEEEAEVQWHIRRGTAGPTLALPSSSARRQPLLEPRTQTPPPSRLPAESNRQVLSTPPPSSPSGTRQRLPPSVQKKKKKRRAAAEGKRMAKGKQPAEAAAQAERERGAAALLRRAARAAKAADTTEGPDTQWLDAWKNMGVAIYGRNNEHLVPGCQQELVPEEDTAVAADGTAAKPMPEPTTQPTANTQSSRSAAQPEKQSWTFGGAYWPSRK